jgi:hypothetical protein
MMIITGIAAHQDVPPLAKTEQANCKTNGRPDHRKLRSASTHSMQGTKPSLISVIAATVDARLVWYYARHLAETVLYFGGDQRGGNRTG